MDQEAQISTGDLALLSKFSDRKAAASKKEKDGAGDGGKNLADIIMAKMAAGDFQTDEDLKATQESQLEPKVIEAYKKLGVVLKTYRSGKLPKTFKIIPQCANWEELLFLTQPQKWSRHAVYEATKVFASNLNTKMA